MLGQALDEFAIPVAFGVGALDTPKGEAHPSQRIKDVLPRGARRTTPRPFISREHPEVEPGWLAVEGTVSPTLTGLCSFGFEPVHGLPLPEWV